jgi:uncharacterized membrane protein
MVSKAVKNCTLWLWGGMIYYLIEVVWRGYSHPSMFAVGGLCFLLLGGINNWLPWNLGIAWQCLIGAASVTAVELISGLILNTFLGLNVWDYSEQPFNLWGQICALYAVLWVPLSAVGIYLDDFLRHKIFDDLQPQYKIF